MKNKSHYFSCLFWAWFSVVGALCAQSPLGTSFTYQGQLRQTGKPAHGTFDMEFYLYDDPDPLLGTVIGVETLPGVVVDKGLFTVELDFGAVFRGDAYWLEIQIWDETQKVYVALEPLQPLRANPYSLYSPLSGAADTAVSAGDANTLDGLDSTAFAQVGTSTAGDLEITGTVAASAFDLNGQRITSWPSDCPWSSGTGTDIYYDGNVGIGASSPTHLLHVQKDYSGITDVLVSNGDYAGTSRYLLGSSTFGPVFWGMHSTSNDDNLYFSIGSSPEDLGVPRLTIRYAGNVGIGSTVPEGRLEIKAPNVPVSGGNSNIGTNLRILSEDVAGQGLGGTIGLGGSFQGTDPAIFAFISGRKESPDPGNASGYLQFSTYRHSTGVVDAMRITSGGDVFVTGNVCASNINCSKQSSEWADPSELRSQPVIQEVLDLIEQLRAENAALHALVCQSHPETDLCD